MLGSNQRPLPCESSEIVCQRSLVLAKCLQIEHLAYEAFLNISGDLLGLLHGCCTRSSLFAPNSSQVLPFAVLP
jgi:hypothetical protein